MHTGLAPDIGRIVAMAMNTHTADGGSMAEINTTPLIDVMLVLLTLMIMTLPIQSHAIKLNMPLGETPPGPPPPTVDLGVDFDGHLTWNGRSVSRATLDRYFAAIAKKPDARQDEIHVTGNRLAHYDAVAMVLADAQRLGVTHIGFAGIDQYN
jgi:biopolymer transport protein ExbD